MPPARLRPNSCAIQPPGRRSLYEVPPTPSITSAATAKPASARKNTLVSLGCVELWRVPCRVLSQSPCQRWKNSCAQRLSAPCVTEFHPVRRAKTSPRGDPFSRACAKRLIGAAFAVSARRRFEHPRLERVAVEQAVELGAVAAGEARRLRDVARGDLEDARQVVALERAPRLVERRERRIAGVERLAHQRRRNHVGRRERHRLLDHVQQLAHVARPGRRHQQFHRLGREREPRPVVALARNPPGNGRRAAGCPRAARRATAARASPR